MVFGGSVIAPAEPDAGFLHQVAQRLKQWSRDRALFVVVGGGQPARRAITTARAVGVGEEALDRIGIAATRLNAQTLCAVLRHIGADCNLEVPHTIAQAIRFAEQHAIVVMGGTEPGHSTDYVAVELAVQGRCARFVNATNVDGVYTRDPSKHRDARFLPRLSFTEMLQIIEEREWTAAGAPGVIDGPSTVLIARHGIPTRVCNGKDLDNLGRAIAGDDFHGTTVMGEAVAV